MADEVEVVLTEDEPLKTDKKVDGIDATTEVEVEDKVTDDIEEVRRNLATATARAEAAERDAAEARRRAVAAENSDYTNSMTMMDTALETIKQNRMTLRQQAASLTAEGNFEKAEELRDQMADLAARQLEIEKGKAALQARGPEIRQPQRIAVSDTEKIDAYLKSINADARASAWIRAHPQFALDPSLNQKLRGAHAAAVDLHGHPQGSDAYYAAISNALGLTGEVAPTRREAPAPPAADPTAQAAKVTQRRDEVQPPPAGASRGGSPRRVTLSHAQQEAAAISGMSHEEYGRSLERERKAGTLIFTENLRKH